MNLITASMGLKDDQARTKNIKLNEFPIRRGKFSYESIKQVTNTTLIVTVFFSLLFPPLFMEGLLHYIAPF